MSTTFSARKVCEMALQKVGAYSLADSGADGAALERTLDWFDAVMAEFAGHQRIFWLVPDTLTMPLTGGESTYDVLNALGASAPELGVQFPIGATLVREGGHRQGIDIITREEYEALPNKTQGGIPSAIYIDRLERPTLRTWPVLAADATGYSLDLVVQTYAPAFSATRGQVATELRRAWQLWAIEATAYTIGSGPVRVLDENRLERIQKNRDEYERRLLAFENRQHATTSGRTKAKDF